MKPSESMNGRGACGASLVEVLVALVLLAVGVLAVTGLMAYALRTASEATHRAERTRVVAEVVDSLVVSGEVERGERPFAAGTVQWGPAEGSVGRRLEIVAPSGEEGDPDTLRIPLEVRRGPGQW